MPARPMSPHLSVYRFMYTMALSILHRITGMILAAGLILLAWWLMTVASGPVAYAAARSFMSGWWVKLLLLGWLASFTYHLCNGIRHLTWDLGLGMEKHEARQSGRAMLLAAVVLFLALGYLAYFVQGNALPGNGLPGHGLQGQGQ